MLAIFGKICIYLLIILAGALLKKAGRLSKEDAKLIGVIIVNLTLPAALIRNADSIVIGPELPALFFFGIQANVLGMLGGYFLNKGKREPKTAAMMLTVSSYNIGAVLLPFVEMFFPGTGVAYLCMFDVGNAIMGLGISYAIAKSFSKPEGKLTFQSVLKTLVSSIPFMTYVVLFAMACLHLKMPQFILNTATVIGNANGFLAMLMIGLLLEVHLPKEKIVEVMKVAGMRYAVNLALMLVLALLPFGSPFMKMIVMLCLASPVASASVVYILDCGYKGDLTGLVSTVSMLISLGLIIVIILTIGFPYAAAAI
ncbi:AEC family transporter [Allobaculum mucilyticum]|uniref:AEC family transporter n=1 Tax=Allobaculum mucilyticum TaxID=2834459 RepID=UPI001E5CF27A|nr:transporter [Allobaculum mucilyticum]UNT96223.1 transporter [Allobaculum mucilyticum]